jgi:ribosomal protein S7
VKQLKQKKRRSQVKEFPYIINNKNRISLALKSFLNKTKNKNEIKMYKKLATELLAIANNSGVSTNKKRHLYEYAFLKKKYFYYR